MREKYDWRIKTRKNLWIAQKGICVYCGRRITEDRASLDHVIPIDLAKESYMRDNFVVTCKRCNVEKGNHIVFSLLADHIVYPMITVPYFFNVKYIQTNKFKEK